MELIFVILGMYVGFFLICFIISCTHLVRYQRWPDGEQILSGLTKMVPKSLKRK